MPAVDAPDYRDPPEVRASRQLQYFLILAQYSGIDLKKTPADELLFDIESAYERRGYTAAVIQNWIQTCDPEVKPSWDEIACFRTQVETAMKPASGLGTHLAVIGAISFTAAFVLSRVRR